MSMLTKVIKSSYKLLRQGGRLIINIDNMTRKDKDGDYHYTFAL